MPSAKADALILFQIFIYTNFLKCCYINVVTFVVVFTHNLSYFCFFRINPVLNKERCMSWFSVKIISLCPIEITTLLEILSMRLTLK